MRTHKRFCYGNTYNHTQQRYGWRKKQIRKKMRTNSFYFFTYKRLCFLSLVRYLQTKFHSNSQEKSGDVLDILFLSCLVPNKILNKWHIESKIYSRINFKTHSSIVNKCNISKYKMESVEDFHRFQGLCYFLDTVFLWFSTTLTEEID